MPCLVLGTQYLVQRLRDERVCNSAAVIESLREVVEEERLDAAPGRAAVTNLAHQLLVSPQRLDRPRFKGSDDIHALGHFDLVQSEESFLIRGLAVITGF